MAILMMERLVSEKEAALAPDEIRKHSYNFETYLLELEMTLQMFL